MRTIVAVIAYNEEENIRQALQDLRSAAPDYDVVVIDNASVDRTVLRAREASVGVISHCVNTGGSFGTVRTYFQYAYEHDYDVLCQFDGDGQHIAEELSKIVGPIERGEADYVIGSRFLEKKGFQSSFLRQIGIRLFSRLDSLIIGQPVTDVTSGFRAYGREVIAFFALNYRHEIHDSNQSLLLSHFAGARIREVPVVMRERLHGVSEFQFRNALAFPFKGLVNILGCLLQRRQIRRMLRGSDGN